MESYFLLYIKQLHKNLHENPILQIIFVTPSQFFFFNNQITMDGLSRGFCIGRLLNWLCASWSKSDFWAAIYPKNHGPK